jgi:hypothetical protein
LHAEATSRPKRTFHLSGFPATDAILQRFYWLKTLVEVDLSAGSPSGTAMLTVLATGIAFFKARLVIRWTLKSFVVLIVQAANLQAKKDLQIVCLPLKSLSDYLRHP